MRKFLLVFILLLGMCLVIAGISKAPAKSSSQSAAASLMASRNPLFANHTPSPAIGHRPVLGWVPELPTLAWEGSSQPPGVSDQHWHIAGEVMAPILLYHRIEDQQASRYEVSSTDFALQMSLLHRWNYTAIPLSLLIEAIQFGAELPSRPVVITFDDGYRSVYENALPVMEQYGFTATVYVILDQIGVKGYLTSAQLEELVEKGWEIGSHTRSHINLRRSGVKLNDEIANSRLELEKLLGAPVLTFSFPYGLTSAYITQLVQDAGYQAAVGLGTTSLQKPDRLYYLSRIEVQGGFDLAKFTGLLPWHEETETIQSIEYRE